MGRRKKQSVRCMGCRMVEGACVCAALPSFELDTHVAIVGHYRELRKTTNTGFLAHRALTNSALHVWGQRDAPLDEAAIIPADHTPLVLTTAPGSVTLTAAHAARRPIALIVPDGSWRQAVKIPQRVGVLRDAPRVHLPTGPPTRWHVREEHRAYGLATLEAIARALDLLGHPDAAAALTRFLDVLVAETLRVRGRTA